MFVQSLKFKSYVHILKFLQNTHFGSSKYILQLLTRLHMYWPNSALFLHFLMSQRNRSPAIFRKGFCSVLSLKTGLVCHTEPYGEFIYLKAEFILFTVIKTVGEPWDGFIPCTSKCIKYEHPSENSEFEEPRKENYWKLHFIGHWETAMCLIPNSEIRNPHIRKKMNLEKITLIS